MKISARQKDENRRAIIDAAVGLVIDKGLRGASMRAIAHEAGVADATIYNYFPTKEAIVLAFYEDRIAAAVARLEAVDGLAEYSLQEHLQALFEELLNAFLPDREFLQATFRAAFFAMPPNHRELRPIRSVFLDAVGRAFELARERGELEEGAFEELVVRFFWDYFLGATAYWLKDTSEGFAATSILLDKTMDIGCAMLRAGVLTKIFDVCAFLFRNHIVSLLDGPWFGMELVRAAASQWRSGARPDAGSEAARP